METRPDSLEVFTIGHSNVPADTIIALLRQYHIETLVDVRSAPLGSPFRA